MPFERAWGLGLAEGMSGLLFGASVSAIDSSYFLLATDRWSRAEDMLEQNEKPLGTGKAELAADRL